MGVDDDGMQCTDHPFPGGGRGICAFCLQEKLGKLVSSSSSSSPCFRSDVHPSSDIIDHRMPFLQNKSPAPVSSMVLKRSKSTATPRSDFSPRRRGFWSFLHGSKKVDKPISKPANVASAAVVDDCPNSSGSNAASSGHKVSRSRSVGCGSRSFSGDFLERISTGLGDCTLRRVESQREGSKHRHSTSRDTIRDKARCGGLFAGFIITSSSSSSYWTSGFIHGRSRSWG